MGDIVTCLDGACGNIKLGCASGDGLVDRHAPGGAGDFHSVLYEKLPALL